MNLQIDIQEMTETKDSYGSMVENWTTVEGMSGLWASMITTGGGEFYAAQKRNSETTVLFKLRYVSGIKPTHRVQYGDRAFDILYVNNKNEASEFLLLSCKEVV